MKSITKSISALLIILMLFCSCSYTSNNNSVSEVTSKATVQSNENTKTKSTHKSESNTSYKSIDTDNLPEFNNYPYATINNNIPDFDKSDMTTTSYETYGRLDYLGRCTSCIACIGRDLMPTTKRGAIGEVKPTGWRSDKYENIDGHYLYNRCHLIGYQLTAENANERNLITGTRYLNVQGMLPFEEEVAEYVKTTGNHVLYKVTPIFKGAELLARGVQMQAKSVEDNGSSVSFNVYCYNVQPGIEIDYKTGYNKAIRKENTFDDKGEKKTYIININTKKFHNPSCKSVSKMKAENKKTYKGTRKSLINNGYTPCGYCKP